MFRTLLIISLLNTGLLGVANASRHKEEKKVMKKSEEENSKEMIREYNKKKAKEKIQEIEEVDEIY